MTDERIVAVTMPKWGLSMQLGKITAWAVAEGDEVQVGDDLADIETEKITGTLEAADAGTVRRIVAGVGEDVPVSGTIALIAPPEVGDDALDDAVREARAVIEAGVPDDAGGAAELQTADVGGRKISYAGAGEDGDVILLIHGYGGDRNSWLFLQEPLAAKYRVYALDLPGHGTSAKDVGDGALGVLADAVTGAAGRRGPARGRGRGARGDRRRGAGHRGLGPCRPDHPGGAGRVGVRRGPSRDRRGRAHAADGAPGGGAGRDRGNHRPHGLTPRPPARPIPRHRV